MFSKIESVISIKWVLSELKDSTPGNYDWKKRKPSAQIIRQARIKEVILEIHEDSYQIYGIPKIKEVLLNNGFSITQRTVSKYTNEAVIKAHYIKPYTITTIDSHFSIQLRMCLKRILHPINEIVRDVLISSIFGPNWSLHI